MRDGGGGDGGDDQDWLPIEGAVSPEYAINGSHEAINNQTIRCLVTSSGGSAASESYVVMVVAATPSPSRMAIPDSDGGSSSNVGAIVGGVVGGAGALFCLLLILMVVLAIVLTRRQRGRHAQKKLLQPDYVALAYGDLDNVALPKKKAEVRAPQSSSLQCARAHACACVRPDSLHGDLMGAHASRTISTWDDWSSC
jgi:hypothetical protein